MIFIPYLITGTGAVIVAFSGADVNVVKYFVSCLQILMGFNIKTSYKSIFVPYFVDR
jgi:hypothetical protein